MIIAGWINDRREYNINTNYSKPNWIRFHVMSIEVVGAENHDLLFQRLCLPTFNFWSVFLCFPNVDIDLRVLIHYPWKRGEREKRGKEGRKGDTHWGHA